MAERITKRIGELEYRTKGVGTIKAAEEAARGAADANRELDETADKAGDALSNLARAVAASAKAQNESSLITRGFVAVKRDLGRTVAANREGFGNLKTALTGSLAQFASGAVIVGSFAAAAKRVVEELGSMQENARLTEILFGDLAGEVIARSNEISEATGGFFQGEEIQQAINRTGAAFQDLGLTFDQQAEIIASAANTAKVTNQDLETVIVQTIDAMQTGGGELVKWGVRLDDATLKSEALTEEQAKYFDQLTTQEKAQLRYNALIEGMAKFQGDAADETRTLGDEFKLMGNAVEGSAEALAIQWEPIIVSITQSIQKGLAFVSETLTELQNVEPPGWLVRLFGGDPEASRAAAQVQGTFAATTKTAEAQADAAEDTAKAEKQTTAELNKQKPTIEAIFDAAKGRKEETEATAEATKELEAIEKEALAVLEAYEDPLAKINKGFERQIEVLEKTGKATDEVKTKIFEAWQRAIEDSGEFIGPIQATAEELAKLAAEADKVRLDGLKKDAEEARKVLEAYEDPIEAINRQFDDQLAILERTGQLTEDLAGKISRARQEALKKAGTGSELSIFESISGELENGSQFIVDAFQFAQDAAEQIARRDFSGLGQSIGAAAGGAAFGPAGALAGGLVGGAIGGIFDSPDEVPVIITNPEDISKRIEAAIERNTDAVLSVGRFSGGVEEDVIDAIAFGMSNLDPSIFASAIGRGVDIPGTLLNIASGIEKVSGNILDDAFISDRNSMDLRQSVVDRFTALERATDLSSKEIASSILAIELAQAAEVERGRLETGDLGGLSGQELENRMMELNAEIVNGSDAIEFLSDALQPLADQIDEVGQAFRDFSDDLDARIRSISGTFTDVFDLPEEILSLDLVAGGRPFHNVRELLNRDRDEFARIASDFAATDISSIVDIEAIADRFGLSIDDAFDLALSTAFGGGLESGGAISQISAAFTSTAMAARNAEDPLERMRLATEAAGLAQDEYAIRVEAVSQVIEAELERSLSNLAEDFENFGDILNEIAGLEANRASLIASQESALFDLERERFIITNQIDELGASPQKLFGKLLEESDQLFAGFDPFSEFADRDADRVLGILREAQGTILQSRKEGLIGADEALSRLDIIEGRMREVFDAQIAANVEREREAFERLQGTGIFGLLGPGLEFQGAGADAGIFRDGQRVSAAELQQEAQIAFQEEQRRLTADANAQREVLIGLLGVELQSKLTALKDEIGILVGEDVANMRATLETAIRAVITDPEVQDQIIDRLGRKMAETQIGAA